MAGHTIIFLRGDKLVADVRHAVTDKQVGRYYAGTLDEVATTAIELGAEHDVVALGGSRRRRRHAVDGGVARRGCGRLEVGVEGDS